MRRTLAQNKDAVRGFSLTEFAIVLGVFGVIVAGVWVAAATMSDMARQARFSEQLVMVVENIRGHYAGRAQFKSSDRQVMMPELKQLEVFSGDTVIGALTDGVLTPFSGTRLSVCGWSASSVGAQVMCANGVGGATGLPLFGVEVTFARAADCVGAVMRNSDPSTLDGLRDVYIQGVRRASLPWPLSEVTQRCGDNTVVDFVFHVSP